MIQLCLLILAVITLFFGLLVLLNNPKQRINFLYFIFCVGSASWMLANAFTVNFSYFYEPSLSIKLVANQLVVPACTLAALTFLLFAAEFNGLLGRIRTWLYGLAVASLAVSLPVFTDAYTYIDEATQSLMVGAYYWVFILLVAFYMAMTALSLFGKKGRMQQDQSLATQRYYLRLGYILAVIPAFVLGGILAMVTTSDFTALSPVSLLIFLIFAGIAVVRHKLFDFRLIVARALGYVFSLAFIGTVYGLGAFYFVDEVLFNNRSIPLSYRRFVYITIALLFGLTFTPMKRMFDRLSNRIFYRDAYDAQAFIDSLMSILVSNANISKLLHDAAELINSTLKPEFTDFMITDKRYLEGKTVGKVAGSFAKNEVELVVQALNSSKKQIFHIDDPGNSLNRSGLTVLKAKQVALVIGLVSRGNLIGLVLIGAKKSGNIYNKQDKEVFDILADELSLALENSLSYEEIRKFNETLQGEVDDATKQLRHTNEKLKALDETKDEFISMASHQLRTPLTSVKGYVSMVLEGDAGELNEQQKKLLTQAFISSQRMVYLIADLLNVSRLRTGKFIIEPIDTYLPDVIEGELDQLNETAAAKGLKLTFDKPADFPKLQLDETKTRQVIMNFIDNAIYYTPSGGEIHIELEAKPKTVEFRVVDNGLGVPKHEQHHLFTKFYRADNARKARPDGTGLGLFMAKKVVVAQGGAIIFRSTEGKGSTFGFAFPRDKVQVTSNKS